MYLKILLFLNNFLIDANAFIMIRVFPGYNGERILKIPCLDPKLWQKLFLWLSFVNLGSLVPVIAFLVSEPEVAVSEPEVVVSEPEFTWDDDASLQICFLV